jgi:PAS domain S-box-containing protein
MSNFHLLYVGTNQTCIDLLALHFPKMSLVTTKSQVLVELSKTSFEVLCIDDTLGMDEALDMLTQVHVINKSILGIIIATDPAAQALIRAIQLSLDVLLITPIDSNSLNMMMAKLTRASLQTQQIRKQNLLLNQYKNALDSSLFISKTNIYGVITYINDRFCELTGYEPSEIIGKTHRLFKHPDRPQEQIEDLWNTVSAKKVWHGTLINQTKQGIPFYTDTFIVPFLNAQHEIEEYMDMRIDVTALEQHRLTLQIKINEATDEIQQQQDRLIAQSRSAALGEMFDNIAHQWRQPIGAINNAIINAEFALELGGMSDDMLSETFNNISTYTSFLSSTIDDFRNFSNPDKEKVRFSPHTVIRQTLGILQGSFDDNGIFVTYIPTLQEQELVLFGASGELSQVVLNILGNARDVLRDKGTLEAYVSIKLYTNDKEMIIEIADNGGGIPPEVLPKIFDPYFSTKNKAQGTGIGLYMSKTIIEKHYKGKLEAKNSEEGAIFTIRIPMMADLL